MLAAETILFVSLCYIGLLFAVAYFGDRRAKAGRSIINSPYVYALSMACSRARARRLRISSTPTPLP